MSDFSNWKWFDICTNNLFDMQKPKIDKFGNEIIKIKVKGVMHPFGFVNFNKKYIKINSHNNKYCSIGLNENSTYFISDKNGLFKKISGNELSQFLTSLAEECQLIKAKNKAIYEQNQKYLNKKET